MDLEFLNSCDCWAELLLLVFSSSGFCCNRMTSRSVRVSSWLLRVFFVTELRAWVHFNITWMNFLHVNNFFLVSRDLPHSQNDFSSISNWFLLTLIRGVEANLGYPILHEVYLKAASQYINYSNKSFNFQICLVCFFVFGFWDYRSIFWQSVGYVYNCSMISYWFCYRAFHCHEWYIW